MRNLLYQRHLCSALSLAASWDIGVHSTDDWCVCPPIQLTVVMTAGWRSEDTAGRCECWSSVCCFSLEGPLVLWCGGVHGCRVPCPHMWWSVSSKCRDLDVTLMWPRCDLDVSFSPNSSRKPPVASTGCIFCHGNLRSVGERVALLQWFSPGSWTDVRSTWD